LKKKALHKIINIASVLLAFLLVQNNANAQCPTFYDTYGNPSSNPYWINCNGSSFNLEILSDDAYGPFTINWGDGSSSSGGGYTPGGANPSHIYGTVVDTLVVTITINGTGCVITGVVVLEELVSAAIQIPNGGITKACAPQVMNFFNASTNVSATTKFRWDFGDGSPNEYYDASNWNTAIPHVYKKGTVDCGTRVTLYAENYCSFGRPSINTYEPIMIWDIDDARISVSEQLLCYPDTVVTYYNTTIRNCTAPAEGNFVQRYEKWIFIDYFGPGLDSVVDWRPWPPTQPIQIRYPGIGTYTAVLLDSNQCGVDQTSMNIAIIAPPIADFSFSQDTVCTGQSFVFTNLSSRSNQYYWSIIDKKDSALLFVNQFPYDFDTAGTYLFQLVANLVGGSHSCTDTIRKSIVVLPGPESSFTANPREACDTLVTSITNTTVNGISWSWDFGNGTTSNQRYPTNPFQYNAEGAYSISLTVTSANNCASILYDTVNVYRTPEVNFFAANACIGSPVNFMDSTLISPNDTIQKWAWEFGEGSISSLQNPVHQYAIDALYNVKLAVNTAHCSSSIIKPVTLHPVPSAIMYLPDTAGCSPFTLRPQNFSTVSIKYKWDFGDGSPVDTNVTPTHTFVNNSAVNLFYKVQLVAITDKGCTDTTFKYIQVYPATTGSFTHNAQPACGPYLVQFVNRSTGGANFEWTFGDGSPTSVAPNPAHLYENNSSFIQIYDAGLIVTSSNGCKDTVTQPITVYPEPNFDFTMSPDEGCTPLKVDFYVATNGNYKWDFGNGNSGVTQSATITYSHTNDFATTYNVRLIGTSTFGCVDTVIKTVTVKPNPIADFDILPKAGCSPLTTTISNKSVGANNFQWDYGDGSTGNTGANNHSHPFYNNSLEDAISIITLTVKSLNNCESTFSDTVTIFGNPKADFDEPIAKCTPAEIGFINRSQNAASYAWNFNDGSPEDYTTAPTHIFTNNSNVDATINVSLIAYTQYGCSDTVVKSVTIYPLPNTNFKTTPPSGCHPLTVNLENTTTGAVGYQWFYGNGTGSTKPDQFHDIVLNNTSSEPVDYEIQLVATSNYGCNKKVTKYVEVLPKVVAAYAPVAPGCTPHTLTLSNKSKGAVLYKWIFPDGISFDEDPSTTLINNSNSDQYVPVTLIAESQYGCTDTITNYVLVYPKPKPSFTVDSLWQMYPNATVKVTNTTPGANWSWKWEFGDGIEALEKNPVPHTYPTWGEYIIKLTVVGQFCEDTVSQKIIIDPAKPIAEFSYDKDEGCVPLTVQFFNQSKYATNLRWNFGDGNNSQQENPIHTYTLPGIYTVSLTASGSGGSDQEVKQNLIKVREYAVAYFTLNPQFPQEVYKDREPVDFYNLSQNADPDLYVWDFGDGEGSGLENPVHYYSYTGIFDVQLIANNEYNCPDTFKIVSAVNIIEGGRLQMPNAFTPNPNGPSGGSTDGVILSNDVFFPFFDEVEKFHMQIFNRWGELIFETNDIDIGWDGYFNGVICPQDVYVYKVAVVYPGGETDVLVGDVTLLK
jgi:gliding motility-associated-like protein